MGGKFLLRRDGYLHVTDVVPGDADNYTCLVSFQLGGVEGRMTETIETTVSGEDTDIFNLHQTFRSLETKTCVCVCVYECMCECVSVYECVRLHHFVYLCVCVTDPIPSALALFTLNKNKGLSLSLPPL